MKIQVIIADSFDDVRRQIKSSNITYTVQGDPSTLKIVGERLGKEVQNNTYALVDPDYDLKAGVVWLSIIANRMAHNEGKQAVAVWDFQNLSSSVKDFFDRHQIYIHPIKKVWQFLKDMFGARLAVGQAA